MAKRAAAVKSRLLDRYLHNRSHARYKKYLQRLKTRKRTGNGNDHAMHTRSKTKASSRNAVFNMTELLENILLHLPHEYIVPARGVNKRFKAIIEISPKIQRKMAFWAETDKTCWEWDTEDMKIVENKSGETRDNGKEWTVPAELSPMLVAGAPGIDRSTLKERIKRCETICFKDLLPSLYKEDSIYSKVLLCQPPAKQLEFELYYFKRYGNSKGRFRRRREGPLRHTIDKLKGVTLGDLVRAFNAAIGNDVNARGCRTKLSSDTVFYLGGVVFPTEDERRMVKRNSACADLRPCVCLWFRV